MNYNNILTILLLRKKYDSLAQLAHRLRQHVVAENTYSEVSWHPLQTSWNNINGLVDSRRSQLIAEHQTQEKNEHLRVDFATKAQAFLAFIKDHSHRIESLHGEIQHQIDQLHVLTGEVAEEVNTKN